MAIFRVFEPKTARHGGRRDGGVDLQEEHARNGLEKGFHYPFSYIHKNVVAWSYERKRAQGVIPGLGHSWITRAKNVIEQRNKLDVVSLGSIHTLVTYFGGARLMGVHIFSKTVLLSPPFFKEYDRLQKKCEASAETHDNFIEIQKIKSITPSLNLAY